MSKVTSSDDSFDSDARSVDFFRELVHGSRRIFVRMGIDVALSAAVRTVCRSQWNCHYNNQFNTLKYMLAARVGFAKIERNIRRC